MENVYLCSFADSRMSPTLERVRRQAEASLFFKKVFLYDEHLLGDLFLKKFRGQLIKGCRGFGYWVWKPYVILETLKKYRMEQSFFIWMPDVGLIQKEMRPLNFL